MAPKQSNIHGLLFTTTALVTGVVAVALMFAERDVAPPAAPQNVKAVATKNGASGRDPDLAINRMIDRIIDAEGSKYVNHPADKGGPTRWGVTQETLSRCRGTNCSIADVKSLTREEAVEIFREHYYLAPRINLLPATLQPQLFDMSVNHGPSSAVKMLQDAANTCAKKCGVGGCTVDGMIGPQTIGAVSNVCKELGDAAVNNALLERRLKKYEDIVEANPKQAVFSKGWKARAESFRLPEHGTQQTR